MTWLLRCDRCGATVPTKRSHPRDWQTVAVGGPHDVLAVGFDLEDVCPDCQTDGERADALLREIADGADGTSTDEGPPEWPGFQTEHEEER